LLSWESIEFKNEAVVVDESQLEDTNRRLNNKYNLYIKEKEEENQKIHNVIKLL